MIYEKVSLSLFPFVAGHDRSHALELFIFHIIKRRVMVHRETSNEEDAEPLCC